MTEKDAVMPREEASMTAYRARQSLQDKPVVGYLTIRLTIVNDTPYLCPQIKIDDKIVTGWTNVIRVLDELQPQTHIRHQQIVRRLYELKKHYTSRQLLSHPEASKLLLELVELNRRDTRPRWIEHFVYCESLRSEREFTTPRLNRRSG